MISAMIAAAALLLVHEQLPQSPDPATAGFTQLQQSAPDPVELRRLVLAEDRDPSWAPQTEAALRTLLRDTVSPTIQFRITCGRTRCEIAGVLGTFEQAATNRAIADLQGIDHDARMRKLGLEAITSAFGSTTDKTGRATVLQYVKRIDSNKG